MGRVRFVCMSDLHLGEEDSLLTAVDPGTGEADSTKPSPVLEQLAACLGGLWPADEQPTLILNGDLLELALEPAEHALMAFERMLECFMRPENELFGEMIFLPGNHDHHMWQAAREDQYLKYLSRAQYPGPLAQPWSTTKVFMDMQGIDRLANAALTGVARRLPNLRAFEVLTAYPNYGCARDGRSLVFSHGHFIEPAYSAMSTAMSLAFPHQPPPRDVYELEQENSAWIDFFWSAQGSCGRTGAGMERIYEMTTDRDALRDVAANLASSISKRYGVPFRSVPFVNEFVLNLVLAKVADHVTAKHERQKRGHTAGKPLSDEARNGLSAYAGRFVKTQIEHESGRPAGDMTFVFGHTHKPFEAVIPAAGADDVRVLNSGGWVVDTIETASEIGGAVVLIDAALEAVSVRVYNEGTYEASVTAPGGEAAEGFANEVRARMQAGRSDWEKLGALIEAEVNLRKDLLRRRVKAPG